MSSNKQGLAVCIVGQTGTGKSHTARVLMNKIHAHRWLIYDIQNEYADYREAGADVYTPDRTSVNDFQKIVINSPGRAVLIEEATLFFKSRSRSELMDNILVSKRHKEQIVIMLFHSLRHLPKDIHVLCNYLYSLPTNDSLEYVKRSFEGNEKLISLYENRSWNGVEVEGKMRYNPTVIKLNA